MRGRAMSIRKKGMLKGPLKICVLGAFGVGKTAIVVRFITRRYFSCYNCDYAKEPYEKPVSLDDQLVDLQIHDFCGKDIVHRLQTDSTFREGILRSDGILLVFSITELNTLATAKLLYQLLQNSCRSRKSCLPPVLLVASMSDLSHFRQVSRSEAQQFALKHSSMQFRECSAAESATEVDETFHELLRMIQKNTERQSIKKESKDRKNSISIRGSPKLIRAGLRRFSTITKPTLSQSMKNHLHHS